MQMGSQVRNKLVAAYQEVMSMQVKPGLTTHPQRTPGCLPKSVAGDATPMQPVRDYVGLFFARRAHFIDKRVAHCCRDLLKIGYACLLTPFIPTIRSEAIVIEFAIQNVPAIYAPLR